MGMGMRHAPVHMLVHVHVSAVHVVSPHCLMLCVVLGSTTAAPAAVTASNELELFNSIPELKALGKVFK